VTGINRVITSVVFCCQINNALLGGKELPPDTSEGVIVRHPRSEKQVLINLNADNSKWLKEARIVFFFKH